MSKAKQSKMPQDKIGTGRRKTAIARVRLREGGSGKVLVKHGKEFVEFSKVFPQFECKHLVESPFRAIGNPESLKTMDFLINPVGGGVMGQVQAMVLGISRALVEFNPENREALKDAKCLTRDPREKERMKPGQPGARKKNQFSKR